jgi:hypothetical protein
MWSEPVLVLVALLVLTWGILLWSWRGTLCRLWGEPVLRAPVLVIESDDWGPGPDLHAERLGMLAQALARYRDGSGHPAVMTLGVVLAVPDAAAMARTGSDDYRRIELDDPRCAAVRARMIEGARTGVFALQLHGMEHYWPPTLLAAARRDEAVHAWLVGADFPAYEALPAPLQSRWIDATQLPSRPLDPARIQAAVEEETRAYRRVFEALPRVVVPPTFVWTRTVEEAWLASGIEVIITPGRRYTGRDGAGLPTGAEGPIHNGEVAGGSARYLVRDIYFEPQRGHAPASVLDEARRRFRLGRPALLETHRSNFIGADADFVHSLGQVEALLSGALQAWPQLRFLSPEMLARIYRERPAQWCANSVPVRLHVWLRRLVAIARLRKLAWACGLALPAAALLWLTSAPTRRAGVVT